MCAVEGNMVWLLCGGKYKFLLRSAWIVLATTTMIDISAIIAYWKLAPKSTDSKLGLRLSLLLLVAVLFLYFFAVLLSCFIIIKLSPKHRESQRRSTVLNSNRTSNESVESFRSFSQSSMPYSDGYRRVLPNNAPPLPPPNRYSQRQYLLEVQSSPSETTSITENATRSSLETWNSHAIKDPNSNDGQKGRQNSGQSYTEVPKIVITGPDDPVPIYENFPVQTFQLPAEIQSTLSSEAYLCKTSDLPPSYYDLEDMNLYSGDAMLNSKTSMKGNSNNSPTVKPVSSGHENYISRSVAYQCYVDERQSLEKQQGRIGSRRSKPISFRSENCVDRREANNKQTLEMSMHLAKLDSRLNNSNLATRSVHSKSESYVNMSGTNHDYDDKRKTSNQIKLDSTLIKSSAAHETNHSESKQLSRQFTTLASRTDSFIAKSEPIASRKRYTVDKLPSTSNPETKLLFDAISKTESLFQNNTDTKIDSNVQKLSDDGKLNTVLVLV